MKKFSFIALIAMFFLSSCEKEQSQMSLDTIKGFAIIQGKVLYDEGTKMQDDDIIILNNLVPAIGQTVLIKINYSDYGANNEGTKIFETIVKADSTYSIKIPVSKSISAELSVQPFNANHYKAVNGIIMTIPDALYNSNNNETIELMDRDNMVCNLIIKTKETVPNIELTLPITITGNVSAACERVNNNNEVYSLFGDGTMPISCKAILRLENTATEPSGSIDNRILEYPFDVRNGEYSIDAKFYNGWEYDNVLATVSIEEFYSDDRQNLFEHHYRQIIKQTGAFHTQNIAGLFGTYNVNNNNTTTAKSIQLKAIYQQDIVPVINLELTFRPLNIRDGIYGVGNPEFDGSKEDRLYQNTNVMQWAIPEDWN